MSNKFRFHILGLPHTVTHKDYTACAYTMKVLKFAKMMTERGHTVIHYGHEDSDLQCTEHVPVVTNNDLLIAYGNYDWRKNFFKFDTGDHAYQTFYKNAIREVGLRKQKNDFILPFWGAGTRPICDAHPDLLTVEPGIGYAGGHWANYKIFESYAIMHAYYGLNSVGQCIQNFYDVVIPNYFDPDDFEYSKEKDDYFLFIGRVYEGKGIHIAIQVTEAIGAKLVVAGQSNLEACGYKEVPKHVEFVGYADVEKRKKLMSRAKGAFVASLYNEPFGGVQVECLFSGTPTITTDWGAFTENNIHGVTGYRCRTFEEFCWAAQNIDKIDPKACRDWAVHNFSLEKVGKMYEEYFQSVLNIHGGKGWYEPNPYRQDLDYKKKHYPGVLEKIEYLRLAKEEKPFAERLAMWITSNIDPKRVLDLGCGPGIYTQALAAAGVNAKGIDIDERVDGILHVIQGDLLKLDGTEQADMVMCLEVAEHIDPQYSDDIVRSVYNTIAPGGVLMWTAAQPGQGGVGHINNRPKEYWRKKFADVGLVQNTEQEEQLRQYCRGGYHMGWFVNNVLIFEKPSDINNV
jgi:glycosyltransferase involved in cell wall biosynthesis